EHNCRMRTLMAGTPFAARGIGGVSFSDEKFLASKTGTIVLLVVRLCNRRPNQLDGRAQLRCSQQFAQNAERRRSTFLSQWRRQSRSWNRESNSDRVSRFDCEGRRLVHG